MNPSEFLNQSEDVKASYLVIMGAITSADHQNSPEEMAFMEQMGAIAGLDDASKTEVVNALKDSSSVDLSGHIAKFANNDLKFALLTDILSLAYKDGSLNANETTYLNDVASQLGISAEQVDALKKYTETANTEAAKTAGNPLVDASGQPKQPSNDFLEKVGLKGMFDKLGIPIGQFVNGTTITAALSTAAFFVLKNYMSTPATGQPQTANTQPNVMGSVLTGLLSSFIAGGGNATVTQTTTANAGGLQSMVTGFFTSQAGQATVNNLLGSFMKSNEKGNGLAGSLLGMLGGNNQGGGQMLQNVLGSFFKK